MAVAAGAAAQEPAPGARRKAPRIGVLLPGSRPVGPSPLVQGLRDLGWEEGRSIRFEHRYADWRPERLVELAAELARLKVDVIVATNLQTAQAAKQATGTIPIVMIAGSDPVARGLVATLERPGGNVTGLRLTTAEVVGSQVEVLKQLLPRLSRLAVVWDTAVGRFDPSREAHLQSLAAGVELIPLEVRGPDDLDRVLTTAAGAGAGAFTIVESPLFWTHRRRLAELALRRRLPAAAMSREFAEAGFLLAYGPNAADLWRRVAVLVDRILKGARPADLPVEQPSRYDLVLNLRTAGALRLTAPPAVIARAQAVLR